MKTEKQMATAAAEFAERWKGRGYERGESQPFWIDLLTNVFGIETPTDGFITFEEHHKVDASNYVDGRIRSTRVLIEQKSIDKDLRAPVKQSDGSLILIMCKNVPDFEYLHNFFVSLHKIAR